MQVIYAPEQTPNLKGTRSIFLGGTIDNGAAVDWQAEVTKELHGIPGAIICNPRRPDWNPNIEISIDNPAYVEQVEWELKNLDACEVICFYFTRDGKSPVTMMELGIFSERSPKKVVVYCPQGFWRKGNVDIVCRDAGIPVYTDFPPFIYALSHKLTAIPYKS